MKILDEFRNYLIEPKTKVIYIDNKVSIINYDTIKHFDNDKVIVSANKIITIKGCNLVVKKLLNDEVLVEGKIDNIEFRWDMKNKIIYDFKNKLKIKVKGKNIERFIKRLVTNNIELLKIDYIKYNEVDIIIYKSDYNKILDLKTIYEVTIVDIYGIIKLQKKLKLNMFLLLFSLFGIFIIVFLSNVIFKIEVVHNSSDVRKFILNELETYNIKERTFKKSFNELQTIKNSILEKYKDKIEWLEIESLGTKYIVRLQERLTIPKNTESNKVHIVSSKDAIIKNVVAKKGEILKTKNEHVKKGEVVITGEVKLNDEIKEITGAEGTIYGEVWYDVSVTYPLFYLEEKETSLKQEKFVFRFLNKEFQFGKKYKKIEESKLLNHLFLPIGIYRQSQVETINISEVLTYEQAINKALELSKKKIELNLDDDEYIISTNILKTNIEDEKVEVKVFYAIYENITDYVTIGSE